MKKCHVKTIDARHNKIVKEIKEDYNNLPLIQRELNEKKENLSFYSNKKKNRMDDEDFKNYIELTDDIKKKIKK